MKRSGQQLRFVSLMISVAAVIILIVGWMVIGTFTRQTASGGELALPVSEAGIHYAMHALNSGACHPSQLAAQQSMVDIIVDERTGEPLGRYRLDFDVVEQEHASFVTITSQGFFGDDRRNCQNIEVTLESFLGARGVQYRLLSWNHLDGTCRWPATIMPLVC